MARYSWIRRTLENWADHWIKTADGLEAVNQIHRWMTEGINEPGNTFRTLHYMPIMDPWIRKVHISLENLPTKDHQRVVVERYCGIHWDRRLRHEHCEALRMPGWRFAKLLTEAHHSVEATIAPEKQFKKRLKSYLSSSTLHS